MKWTQVSLTRCPTAADNVSFSSLQALPVVKCVLERPFVLGLQVPMERRINRVTAAVFHFSSGAVGSLTHSLVLHTSYYQTGLPL